MWCLVSQANSVILEVQVDPKAIGQECLEKVSHIIIFFIIIQRRKHSYHRTVYLFFWFKMYDNFFFLYLIWFIFVTSISCFLYHFLIIKNKILKKFIEIEEY